MRRYGLVATFLLTSFLLSCRDNQLLHPNAISTSISIQPDSVIVVRGADVQLQVTLTDRQGRAMPNAAINWRSADTTVATVSPLGVLRGVAFGRTRVTASVGTLRTEIPVIVLYPARDSALVTATDSASVAVGNGTIVTVAAGAFPTGTLLTLEQEATAPDTSDGPPLGPTFRLRVSIPSTASASLRAERRPNLSTIANAFQISTILNTTAKLSTDVVSLVIRPAADVTTKTILNAVDVAEKTGEFVNARFAVPFSSIIEGATGVVYDLEFSPVHATANCDSQPSTWAFYNVLGSSTVPNTDKIPLVLIHGFQVDKRSCQAVQNFHPEEDTWAPFIQAFKTSDLANRYELWVYRYPTFYSIENSAARLSTFINSKLPNRETVLIGHSMGGLVGAYYVGVTQSNRVHQLITLATPFRGSPAAVRNLTSFPSFDAMQECMGTQYLLGAISAFDIVAGNFFIGTEGGRELNPNSAFYTEQLDRVSARFTPKLWSLHGTTSWSNVLSGSGDALLMFFGCYILEKTGEENDGLVTISSAEHYGPAALPNWERHDHYQMAGASDVIDSVLRHLSLLSREVPAKPKSLSVAAGDNQIARPGQQLPIPIAVQVSDVAGVPVPGVTVQFQVTSGGGSLAASAAGVTDTSGIAWATWTLGLTPGPQTATASVAGLLGSPVTFNATASEVVTPTIRAQVSAGNDHACAITSAGQAYCWGSNVIGSLGNDNATDGSTPSRVSGNYTFASISAGGDGAGSGQYEHSCGVTTGGTGLCWGSSTWGELGTTVSTCGFQKQGACVPVPVEGNLEFSAIAAGNLHTCGLTRDGAAYCWGYGGFGALGTGSTVFTAFTPQAVVGGLTFKSIDAARHWTCALTPAGAAYCWGGTGGGLGSLTPGQGCNGTCVPQPTLVAGGHTFKAITVGGSFSCGVTTDGDAYCWGGNTWGQLGDGTTTDSPLPVRVTGGLKFTAIDAGAEHVCAITAAGAAYCWGAGLAGNLGNGGMVESHVPVPVSGGFRFVQISAGTGFTCGTTTDAKIYCWGWDSSGKLGNGSAGSSTIPVFVLDGSVGANARASRRATGR